MSKKQTAVEWLVEELTKQNMFMNLFAKEIETAKAMDIKQKIDAYIMGVKSFYPLHEYKWKKSSHEEAAKEYYKETYEQ